MAATSTTACRTIASRTSTCRRYPLVTLAKLGLGQFRFLGIFKRQYTTDSDSPHFRESTQPYFASGGDAQRGPSRAPSGMTSTARTSARWRIAETPLQIGCWLRRRLLCDSSDSSLYLLCTEMSAGFLRLSRPVCHITVDSVDMVA